MDTQNPFIAVKTWRNRNRNKNIESKAGYGIRIKKDDFGKIENWKILQVGEDKVERGQKKFTQKCPEIRDYKIGKFLFDNHMNSWEKGNPHTLNLYKVGREIYEIRIN